MQQSKLESLIETCLNVAIGFCISLTAWPFVAVLYGIEYSHSQNLGITLIFTVLSISRGYIVRRWFNHGLHHTAAALAAKLLGSRT